MVLSLPGLKLYTKLLYIYIYIPIGAFPKRLSKFLFQKVVPDNTVSIDMFINPI